MIYIYRCPVCGAKVASFNPEELPPLVGILGCVDCAAEEQRDVPLDLVETRTPERRFDA